jgi:hypothetical protein
MKKIILTTFLGGLFLAGIAQEKFYTKAGKIKFDATSASSPEKIEGTNNSAVCVLDTKSGALQLSVVMKGFEFEKALMQEHFNENYVESQTYPKAEFRGTITNNSGVNYSKGGPYKVKVAGNLTMHNVTKQVTADGELIVKDGHIIAKTVFSVSLSDYQIKIPSAVSDKVATVAKISVDCSLDVLNK